MANIVLLHGGWSAKWVWDFNKEFLEKSGHNVICLDLPGHGSNAPETLENVGLKDHVDYVEKELNNIDGKVVLVAHSMTGMVISQIAEDMPEKVEKLVFVAAFMPNSDNQCMTEFLEEDKWNSINDQTIVKLPNGLVGFNPLFARNLGFGSFTDEQFGFALSHAQPENPTMWGEPVHIGENYHNAKKFYIHTLKDNCCSYYLQKIMVHREAVVKEYYLDTDHCCMLSGLNEFNEAIDEIAKMNV